MVILHKDLLIIHRDKNYKIHYTIYMKQCTVFNTW